MAEMLTLYGVVMSRFNSIQKFANAMGWKRNKAMRICKRIQEPDSNEICKMAEVMEIPDEKTFMRIFFPELSTKWTNECAS